MTRTVEASVLETLFDFSFTHFITLKVVKLLYVLVVVGTGLLAFFLALVAFQRSFLTGLGGLIVAALSFLVVVALCRIGLEATVVFFRIADNSAEIAEQAAAIAVNTGKARTSSQLA